MIPQVIGGKPNETSTYTMYYSLPSLQIAYDESYSLSKGPSTNNANYSRSDRITEVCKSQLFDF
jgi:hypothetical protein